MAKEYVCCSGCGRDIALAKSYASDSQYCVFCLKQGRTRQTETKDRPNLDDLLDELPGFEFKTPEDEQEDEPDGSD
jgi:hypothetical protein